MVAFLEVLSAWLIPLTILSYLPQCLTLLTTQVATGISVTATLLLALSAQAQLMTMYYLFVCPQSKRYGSVVPKPPRIQDHVNLYQLIVQWTCSSLLLALVLKMKSRSSGASSDDASAQLAAMKSTMIAIAVLLGHAGLCFFWAALLGVPSDDWGDLFFVVIMFINNVCINPLITAATAAAFVLQSREIKATQAPTTLNATTLLLQAVIFLVLAISWLYRFTLPKVLMYYDSWWLVTEWYPHVGWACVNNTIIAIGQFSVLYAANATGTQRRQSSDETQPLIS